MSALGCRQMRFQLPVTSLDTGDLRHKLNASAPHLCMHGDQSLHVRYAGITEDYGERKLVLEPARFFEGGRHIRDGSGLGGDSGCPDTGRASACSACGYTAGYTLSQALHHHAVLGAE